MQQALAENTELLMRGMAPGSSTLEAAGHSDEPSVTTIETGNDLALAITQLEQLLQASKRLQGEAAVLQLRISANGREIKKLRRTICRTISNDELEQTLANRQNALVSLTHQLPESGSHSRDRRNPSLPIELVNLMAAAQKARTRAQKTTPQ